MCESRSRIWNPECAQRSSGRLKCKSMTSKEEASQNQQQQQQRHKEKQERVPNLLTLLPYGADSLRQTSETVRFPLSAELEQLVCDMLWSVQDEQLKAANAPWPSAAGMAAPQWGVNVRLFVWKVDGKFEAVFNATYEAADSEEVEAIEGCFSVPGKRGKVRRWRRVVAKWQTADGAAHETTLEDWPARVWQHETDHTNGKLYDDEAAKRCLQKFDVL